MNFNISILLIIINYIASTLIKDCEISNYCGSEKYACSIYGNCNFRIFDYYKVGSTEEDRIPHCECNMGYSSFDIFGLKQENKIQCCYKKKGLLTAFFLELFLGLGLGHFYLGNYAFGCCKIIIQIFFCVVMFCVMYFACTREHSLQTNYNEINNNENTNINKNIVNENKNVINQNENKNENENEIIDENENENNNENNNDSNEKKNNDSKNQSFELEENKENEIMFKKFVSCPISMFLIYLSGGAFFLFYIVDVFLIAFRFHKDSNGEELYMWG